MPLEISVKKAVERDIENFLQEKVTHIAEENLNKKIEYDENSRFQEDLLFDSLDYADLIVDAEDTFRIKIEYEIDFATPKEFRECLFKKIEQREEKYS